jgi:valyl-tRNA synthetase
MLQRGIANRPLMSELPKTFDPKAIEERWYAHWEAQGLFRPDRPDATPWTIVMPPPNVTGSLHIGHALDNTLQDVLTRRERMRGKDALWVVGTDHAGIATQMVVERNLETQGIKRSEIGREAFLEHVWEWKAQSGGAITRQLRRLGASCDWAHERFTMDERYQRAVTHTFVELYKRGRIYRDKRLVNWDPKFQTAISDLEVDNREVDGHMWHFKYPLDGGATYRYVERDEDGKILFEEERDYISIATTRPETMLGDGAVAVHPNDERYRPIVGKFCEIPVGPKQHRRLIPIITDEYPDPNFGSGAVKITGGHDLNDYGVAQRNNLPMYRLMDERARMRTDGPSYEESANRAKAIAHGEAANALEVDALNLVPEAYRGLDRYEARKRVVADIDSEGLMIKVEDKKIMQPFGDRSNVVIEPMLTDQWYVDAATLAKPAIEATRSGEIRVVPETWKKTWFNWLENIQPWCVSRQLWWGHRIPAWYGPIFDDKDQATYDFGHFGRGPNLFVAESEEEAVKEAQSFYDRTGRKVQAFDSMMEMLDWSLSDERDEAVLAIWRDDDVLDTWFSSALWPFATLGWPEQTDDLKRHYPNDVLISGFDILFFWDARMAMQGLEFMEEVPWKTLYLHGLVRDAHGQKMSKSKGNTVDPLGLIDKYGADALRFTLAAMESQGRDIKLDEKRVEGYRNFATKLWNAARFLQMNGVGASDGIAAPEAQLPVNRWIIGEVVETLSKLDRAFDELRYDGMADAIYHFVWGTFCDWYVELVKPLLSLPLDWGGQGGGEVRAASASDITPPPTPPHRGEGSDAEETRKVAAWAFDQILVMLHPLMPFITEELWSAMGTRPYELIVAKWPEPVTNITLKDGTYSIDAEARSQINWLIETVSAVRTARNELGIAPGQRLTAHVTDNAPVVGQYIAANAQYLERLARLTVVYPDPAPAGAAMRVSVPHATLVILLEGAIDLEAEKARLSKGAAAAEKERDSLAQRLGNPNFTERAKPEAVEKARADHEAKAAEAERLRAALERLG